MEQYHLKIPSPMMEKLRKLSKKKELTIKALIISALEKLFKQFKRELQDDK